MNFYKNEYINNINAHFESSTKVLIQMFSEGDEKFHGLLFTIHDQ